MNPIGRNTMRPVEMTEGVRPAFGTDLNNRFVVFTYNHLRSVTDSGSEDPF